MADSFGSHGTLSVGGKTLKIARLAALEKRGHKLARLPFSLRILLENLLRREDGRVVRAEEIEALARWKPVDAERAEIAFMPARVLLQDFTGVPCVVDLAAMRDAMRKLGGDPKRINPLQPVELVIDHSVQVDAFGSPSALATNAELEFQRNKERYAFLRWGQSALSNFVAVPPDTGIVHQVNLEYLARVVMSGAQDGAAWAYPDTVVGTDSHTTMINGLGVLGWGVGGIEAEAAMLGQPVSMLIPDVVGVKLSGKLPEGATATDLVLVVTQLLRKHGVVGKFVEFFGPGLAQLPLADRATIANMAPEYGATCGIFPVDAETLAYLRFSGRSEEQVALVEAYMKEQGLFHDANTPPAEYSATLELDLRTIEACMAGPKRPQDRVLLKDMKANFATALVAAPGKPAPFKSSSAPLEIGAYKGELNNGAVVIAAITSCTNTSNPSVLMAAGLLAKKAVDKGLAQKPWVKTSLAPGSKVVTDYLKAAGLDRYLDQLGFHTVGYGCTTCIGNSGPLPEPVAKAVEQGDLVVSAVLSGNRNFEGRVHAQVKANYLASPPLVVAYAIAGRVDFDPTTEPLGTGKDGKPVFLRDVWPTQHEVESAIRAALKPAMYSQSYGKLFEGDANWRGLAVPQGDTYAWDASSTYIASPPYFEGLAKEPSAVGDLAGARVLAVFGDSITTDHISPAGSIKPSSPAGKYLQSRGVKPADFNSYGARRGHHEVMMRGTFANVRLKNLMLGGVEGSETLHQPSGERMAIFDAAMRYKQERVPSVILAGAEYGSGSSRDWAAKGPMLLGVRAVIAKSFERIHRSNLVGMGILPLEFTGGQSVESLGLTGVETISIDGVGALFQGAFKAGAVLHVVAVGAGGKKTVFQAKLRIDTPQEAEYYRNGGILQYVLRRLVKS
ncbi:MAG: aconitate hydratase AcnA [Planctomycetota bacterium]|nr:MAG: aconitate hydratase AcnA [Planctomycetota bacterium]